jgi:hypothetical protein
VKPSIFLGGTNVSSLSPSALLRRNAVSRLPLVRALISISGFAGCLNFPVPCDMAEELCDISLAGFFVLKVAKGASESSESELDVADESEEVLCRRR